MAKLAYTSFNVQAILIEGGPLPLDGGTSFFLPYIAMCFKGQFAPKLKKNPLACINASRLFWCEFPSFGGNSCRDVYLLNIMEPDWEIVLLKVPSLVKTRIVPLYLQEKRHLYDRTLQNSATQLSTHSALHVRGKICIFDFGVNYPCKLKRMYLPER